MGVTILLVDDHSVVRQGLRMFLSLDPDLEVVGEASNGAEGIEQARKLKPDVVLMDLLMPVMDGIEVLRRIKLQWPQVEVIIITGYQTVDTAVKAIKLGAHNYIEKPFTPDALLAKVREVIDHA